jgi:hypothetical protein
MLLKQVGGKNMKSSDVEETEEQEWLDMLVDAMTMRRALVVLDDPWLPEQVRYLNPVDGSRTDHRLLVTTRIRSLMPKAACIELALMDEEEAVVLLLDLANVEKNVYLKQASEWPPAAAYNCGEGGALMGSGLGAGSSAATTTESRDVDGGRPDHWCRAAVAERRGRTGDQSAVRDVRGDARGFRAPDGSD